MKVKLAYIGWDTPGQIENDVNDWFEENPEVMIQGIEHKFNFSQVLTIITYVEGAIPSDFQQPQPDCTPVPEDLG